MIAAVTLAGVVLLILLSTMLHVRLAKLESVELGNESTDRGATR